MLFSQISAWLTSRRALIRSHQVNEALTDCPGPNTNILHSLFFAFFFPWQVSPSKIFSHFLIKTTVCFSLLVCKLQKIVSVLCTMVSPEPRTVASTIVGTQWILAEWVDEWILKIKLIGWVITLYSILFFKSQSCWFFGGNLVTLQIQSENM